MMDDDDYDMIFKILIIGDSGVGKSNILLRYVKNEFMSDMRSTVGVEFGSKLLTIDKFQVKAQIWDTAGQERYKSITSAYYKGAKGVLIVYDITKKSSFDNIDKWLNDFKMKCDDNACIVLCGNKSDLRENREVPLEDAQKKAKEFGLAFFETSAKDNYNINLAFTTLMQNVVKCFRENLEENFTSQTGTDDGSGKRRNRMNREIKMDGGMNIHIDDESMKNNIIQEERKCC